MPTTMPITIGVRVRPAWMAEKPSPSWVKRETQRSRPPKAPKVARATRMPLT